MIISYSKKFVILAPWKTASSTTHLRLAAFNESPYSRFYDFNPYLNRVVHQHLTLAEFKALPESRLGFFTAAFVRNPYDKVYSGFRQLQRDIQSQPNAPYPQKWIKALVMGQLSANFTKLCRAGFDFDSWLAEVDDHEIHEVGHNSSFPLHPAHYWTHVHGEQAIDFIGKVENFEADFLTLCSRLQIQPASSMNANVDVDIEPAADGAKYKSSRLMSRNSVNRINELFRQDFELFGYEML
jgi:hypothetical protein